MPVEPKPKALALDVPRKTDPSPDSATSSTTLKAITTTTPPPPPPEETESAPIYKRWWFWTGIAVVAIGAGAGAYLLTRPGCTNSQDSICHP